MKLLKFVGVLVALAGAGALALVLAATAFDLRIAACWLRAALRLRSGQQEHGISNEAHRA